MAKFKCKSCGKKFYYKKERGLSCPECNSDNVAPISDLWTVLKVLAVVVVIAPVVIGMIINL